MEKRSRIHAGNHFDDPGQHIKPGQRRISRASTRLKIQYIIAENICLLGEALSYGLVFHHGDEPHHALGKAGGMAQQIPNRDFPVSRDRFHLAHSEKQELWQQGDHIHAGLECIPLICADLHIFELGKKFGQRVIQSKKPLIHQFQNAHRRYRLGHGHHSVDGIVLDGRTRRHIGITPFVLIGDLSCLAHQQCSAGDFFILDILADCLIDLTHNSYNSFLVKALTSASDWQFFGC